MNEVAENRWAVPITMKAKELEKSLLKYEWNILAKATTFFPSKRRGKKKKQSWGKASLIYFANTSHCPHLSVLLLVTSFDHQGLNKNWSSGFLPYSGSWQSRAIKKKKKKGSRKNSERMSVILLATSCVWRAKRSWWWMGL